MAALQRLIACKKNHQECSARGRHVLDVLSDVLKTVRLTGAAFFDVSATKPFVAEQPPRDIILPEMILPGAERLIAYHAVTEGDCYASIIDGETFHLKAGEVVIFTNGDPHVMASPACGAKPLHWRLSPRWRVACPFFSNTAPRAARLLRASFSRFSRLRRGGLQSAPRRFAARDRGGRRGRCELAQSVRPDRRRRNG